MAARKGACDIPSLYDDDMAMTDEGRAVLRHFLTLEMPRIAAGLLPCQHAADCTQNLRHAARKRRNRACCRPLPVASAPKARPRPDLNARSSPPPVKQRGG